MLGAAGTLIGHAARRADLGVSVCIAQWVCGQRLEARRQQRISVTGHADMRRAHAGPGLCGATLRVLMTEGRTVPMPLPVYLHQHPRDATPVSADACPLSPLPAPLQPSVHLHCCPPNVVAATMQ